MNEYLKEIVQLKSKNTILLTSPDVFALEKKKYLNSVVNALEKSIRFERMRTPHKDRSDRQQLLNEMNSICNDLSKNNQIPFSAFEQIFTVAEIATGLFSLLSLGDGHSYEPEEIPIQRKKKRRFGR